MNDLQEIYTNIKNSTDSSYSKGFSETSSRFVELLNNEQRLTQDDLHILIGKQSNGIADAGQWGGCNKEQFLKISEIWPDIYSILKKGKIRRLTADEYLKVRNIIKNACGRDKKIITNRIFAAFFPKEISATCKEEDFYFVANVLKENYLDYPKITENWLIDNYAFVDFCKNNLTEDESLPIPVFSWKLRDAIKNGIMNKDTNMAKEKSIMNPYVTLLENNKNLILHGAPGTGKTYTAKDIAAQMICGKPFSQIEAGSEDEKLFNEQTEFVQFHPSYDYSDFVEGLRPIEGENTGDVGFERKDGVFKEFCERALKNFLNSQKEVEDVKQELSNKEKINLFLSHAMSEEETFTTAKGNIFLIKDYNDKHVIVSYKTKDSVTYSDVKIKYSDFLVLLEQDKDIDRVEVKVLTGRKVERQEDSYSAILINELRKNNTNADEEIIIEDATNKLKKYIFIIDEINRGEMSKIFGELFFSIDPDYRGSKGKVRTQYANMLKESNDFDDALGIASSYGHFFVPENVYIIGTMNDIDRSVDSMDFAMRRRFTFVELKASECTDMLNKIHCADDRIITVDEIKTKMNCLNNIIYNEKEHTGIVGLSSAYHIGGSYFAKLSKYSDKSKSEAFECLWNNHLRQLITDYLRGLPNLEAKFANFKAKYDAADVVSEESDK